MAHTQLTGLPVEVIHEVSMLLGSLDLQNLRSSCQTLADKTSKSFQDRFFHTRRVMLERQSLLNLVEISRHPVLSGAVQVVELGMDHLVAPSDYTSRADYEACGIVDEYDAVRLHDGETISLGDDSYEAVITSYRAEWGDYKDFLQNGSAITYLVEALSNLPNCKAVGLDDNVRPWGAFRLGRRLGTLPSRFITAFQAQSILFAVASIRILLAAVVRSRRAMEQLYIQFGHLKLGCTSVTPRMLSITPGLASSIGNAFASITTLQLLISPNNHDNTFGREIRRLARPNDPICAEDSDWCLGFCTFLGHFPKLTNLTLQFYPRDEGQQFPRLSQDLYVPSLRSLYLDCVNCTKDQLMALLERHKDTLRELILETVDITGEGRKAWSSVIEGLQRSLALEVVHLGDCMVDGFWLSSWSTTTPPKRLSANGPEELESLRLVVDEIEESETFPWRRQFDPERNMDG